MGDEIDQLFDVHMLNSEGKAAAKCIAVDFTVLLRSLEETCGKDGREMAVVRTKLQEAAFFAKRAMAVQPRYQEGGGG